MTDAGLRGAEVARLYYQDLVGPVLGRAFPGLRYAAARLGSGSDVLGYDDARSRDHDWGCRLTVVLDDPDAPLIPAATEVLERELPETFRGLPVRFDVTWDPARTHNVHVTTVRELAVSRLGVDPLQGLSTLDWLVLTGQGVLEVTAGPVFRDETAELAPLREALAWYPPDVERYVLIAGWQRLEYELPMHGRAAEAGDELGSRLIAARMADTAAHLTFLLSRQWMPYLKWRGTALARIPLGSAIAGPLAAALSAGDWREREDAIAAAAQELASAQRNLGLPAPDTATVPYFDRPFRTIHRDMQAALRAQVTDPDLLRLPDGIGAVEQWAACHDLEKFPERRAALKAAYRSLMAAAPGAKGATRG
jgi:hypothetical protein